MRPLESRDPIRLDHIALRVRDIDASQSFYTEVLGFESEEPGESEARAGTAIRCSAPVGADGAGGVGVELVQGRSMSLISTMDHFSFEVESVDAVLATHARAQRRGARATSPTATAGRLQIFVFDPDGHKIEIFALRSA